MTQGETVPGSEPGKRPRLHRRHLAGLVALVGGPRPWQQLAAHIDYDYVTLTIAVRGMLDAGLIEEVTPGKGVVRLTATGRAKADKVRAADAREET